MKELDQSKRIIPVMMRWPDAWVNIKRHLFGEDEYTVDLIDRENFKRYRKLIEYYNMEVIIQDDGELTIKVPEIVDKVLLTTQNRWIKSNASYSDFLIISIEPESLEFDRAIFCYMAKPSSDKTLNNDDYIIDDNGARYLNLKFKGRIIESKDVDNMAKEWVVRYKRLCDSFNKGYTGSKNHSDESVKSHKVKPIKRKKD